ncbi:mitochondrial cardiolipin hydrolase [Sphaerodactylus townsendi]|uniref:mitochondrial cardiolipin hydrolase n=1 Tax=Sphaerodactylus townsendi TaxID=933632 RepID=UPI0020273E41|nr:mitochondrial cardiolipin hydrolase [Sphaerodactylus townsendi]
MAPRGLWWGLASVAAAVGCELLVEWLLRRREARRLREALFFPSRLSCVEGQIAAAEGGAPCLCSLPHDDRTSLGRLVARLLSARRSLDLCLFAFSSHQLRRVLLLLHHRGVRIRVITDADYMALRGSQIGALRLAGIPVRHDQESGYMHHKFAIIDKRWLLTGSLNWTSQAIQQNRENVLIVEDAEWVKCYQAEFEKLWEDYDPANYNFFSKESRQPAQGGYPEAAEHLGRHRGGQCETPEVLDDGPQQDVQVSPHVHRSQSDFVIL